MRPGRGPPISGLPEIGAQICASRVNPTCVFETALMRLLTMRGFAGSGSPADEPLDFGAQRRREIVAVERIGDVRGEEADLRPAVVALARELQAIEGLGFGERDHGVGELDFAAGA